MCPRSPRSSCSFSSPLPTPSSWRPAAIAKLWGETRLPVCSLIYALLSYVFQFNPLRAVLLSTVKEWRNKQTLLCFLVEGFSMCGVTILCWVSCCFLERWLFIQGSWTWSFDWITCGLLRFVPASSQGICWRSCLGVPEVKRDAHLFWCVQPNLQLWQLWQENKAKRILKYSIGLFYTSQYTYKLISVLLLVWWKLKSKSFSFNAKLYWADTSVMWRYWQ